MPAGSSYKPKVNTSFDFFFSKSCCTYGGEKKLCVVDSLFLPEHDSRAELRLSGFLAIPLCCDGLTRMPGNEETTDTPSEKLESGDPC